MPTDPLRAPQPLMQGEQIYVAPRTNNTVPARPKRSLDAHFGDMVNLLDWCPGNGIDDDQAGLVRAVNAASGKPLFVVPGRKFQPTAPITVPNSAQFNVFGWGNGFGPGAAAQDEYMTSLVRPVFAGGPVFDVQSNYPCRFDNFRIDVHPNFRNVQGGYNANTDAAIQVRGPNSGVNSSTIIRDVAIVGKAQCIKLVGSFVPTITGCRFMLWTYSAVDISSYAGTEGNGGDISGNCWFGAGNNQPGSGPCLHIENGYTKIFGNQMGGGNYAIEVAIKGGNAGDLEIYDNTMEDQYAGSIRLATLDGSTLTVFIERNWMSILNPAYAATFGQHIIAEDYGTDWLVSSTIARNRMRSGLASASRFIWLQTGQDVDVDDNKVINHGPNNPRGIDVFGPASSARLKSPVRLRRNTFFGTFASRYGFAPGVVSLEHFDPDMTVAQLADGAIGAVRDGSRVFANDGNPASFTGGSTGAFYKRQGGLWVPG